MKTTIIDSKGKAHKLITSRIENVSLFIAIYNMDDIYRNINQHIPKDIADDFLDVIERLEREVGTIQCDTVTDVYLMEHGYNIDE